MIIRQTIVISAVSEDTFMVFQANTPQRIQES